MQYLQPFWSYILRVVHLWTYHWRFTPTLFSISAIHVTYNRTIFLTDIYYTIVDGLWKWNHLYICYEQWHLQYFSTGCKYAIRSVPVTRDFHTDSLFFLQTFEMKNILWRNLHRNYSVIKEKWTWSLYLYFPLVYLYLQL